MFIRDARPRYRATESSPVKDKGTRTASLKKVGKCSIRDFAETL